jgi:hypothetical protein
MTAVVEVLIFVILFFDNYALKINILNLVFPTGLSCVWSFLETK